MFQQIAQISNHRSGVTKMTAGVDSREQRLRKQAELQSLNSNLANLREQEDSYISVQAATPERLTQQITKVRQQIQGVQTELISLGDETVETPARQFYWEAFAAELTKDEDKALKLYRNAARYDYPDANAAIRSLKHLSKVAKNKATIAASPWSNSAGSQSRGKFFLGVIIVILIFAVIVALGLNNYLSQPAGEAVVLEAATALIATVIPPTIIVPNTATPNPTLTSLPATPTNTATPLPSTTATLIPPTPSPTPTSILRGAPAIIGPRDGLVWGDGAIVFEFENMGLAENELYCLNTLKGFDKTLTENWSYPPVGSKTPRIPVEKNVFRTAKVQEIQCIVWSAYIGRDNCQTIISQTSPERVIGLPQTCPIN